MVTFTLRAVWPVLDDGMTLHEVTTEADDDLPNVAARHKVAVAGRAQYCLRPGVEVPGFSAWDLVLVGDVPVRALSQNAVAALLHASTKGVH